MTELNTNPQDISRLAEAFQSVSEDIEITTDAPSSTLVDLPGGHIFKDGSLAKFAQIRELNGADEEAIAKAGSANRALNTILTRGLVSIGDEKITSSDLNTLLTGDREALLLGIRIATFGSSVEFSIVCEHCAKAQTLNVDLNEDIKIVELDDPIDGRVITVQTKAGEVLIALPNGLTNKRLIEIENSSVAEVITELLAGCLISVNGMPSLGKSTALNLGILDRELLAAALYEQSPGPRLMEVTKTCQACDSEISLALSLADLFRL